MACLTENSSSLGSNGADSNNHHDSRRIKYSLVKSEQPNVIRYAAYELTTSSSSGSGSPSSSSWEALSVQRWAELLSSSTSNDDNTSSSDEVRSGLSHILADAPYKAFFFETKGVSSKTSPSKQFEFALIDTPYLYKFANGNPDPFTFADYLNCSSSSSSPDDHPPAGCVFASLSGDTLIAPRAEQDVPNSAYSHLGAFVRSAPDHQVDRFWKLVGKEYAQFLKKKQSVWLSTDGRGVAWLHVRLDSRPKYYSYSEFANET
eukprot:CAMPEP_0195525272 /NCGR_PEP_ID=MMETSP0794_2-20130614/25639_1 /TAXON_ID=515487 /ORGANISM="Stephanopyxis turris, Strain CCMP 815" /LENGTH=260 /DNA_ID=CAMNT_0040655697 /DNA_START=148 /DNA_END=930 /DNA_ORIENTATION=+